MSDVAGNPILSRENVRTHGIILMKSLGSGGRLDIFNLGSGHFFFFNLGKILTQFSYL